VDDDPNMNRMAERMLPPKGFDLSIAVDVASAMRGIDRGGHDAIVLDQRLPGSRDLDVLRRLRRAGDRTPVVILTGYGTPEAAVEALTLGVIDYLVKPAQTERILAALRISVRAGACEPISSPPAIVLHPHVSLGLVAILFNLPGADPGLIRTQLAWAVADEGLSFAERVAAVEALSHSLKPASTAEMRRQVSAWLRRALGRRASELAPATRTFVRLVTTEASRTWHNKTELLASEAGTSVAELSRLVYQELGVVPDRCRLIGHLEPALRELAHSNEQVAQIAYRLRYNLPSGFDNAFKKVWGIAPTEYRGILTGLL
jgi:DNA-binding response OmpR family regulator